MTVSNFTKDKGRVDGLDPICRWCRARRNAMANSMTSLGHCKVTEMLKKQAFKKNRRQALIVKYGEAVAELLTEQVGVGE
jgi:pyruvate-formate lyase-activating enzyme